jgi:predicted HicB family RNase H-like nuclease
MNDSKKELKFVAKRLPKELHLSAKKRALEENRSLQDLITEILEKYLKSCTEKA